MFGCLEVHSVVPRGGPWSQTLAIFCSMFSTKMMNRRRLSLPYASSTAQAVRSISRYRNPRNECCYFAPDVFGEDESEWEQAAAWRRVSALLCPLGRVRIQERRWAEDNGGRRPVPPDAKKDFLRAVNTLPDNPEKAARIVAKYVGR